MSGKEKEGWGQGDQRWSSTSRVEVTIISSIVSLERRRRGHCKKANDAEWRPIDMQRQKGDEK